MFAWLLICISLTLLFLSKGAHLRICALFAFGIIADKFAYVIIDRLLDNTSFILFIAYAFIESFVLWNLVKKLSCKPPVFLVFLTAVNIMYNACTALAWTRFGSRIFYDAFSYSMGFIVIMQLLVISRMLYARNDNRSQRNSDSHNSDWLFCVFRRSVNRIYNRQIS